MFEHQKDRPPANTTPAGRSFKCSNTRRTVRLVFEHQKDHLLVQHQKGVLEVFGPSVWCLNMRRTVFLLVEHQQDRPSGGRSPEGMCCWCSNTIVFEHHIRFAPQVMSIEIDTPNPEALVPIPLAHRRGQKLWGKSIKSKP